MKEKALNFWKKKNKSLWQLRLIITNKQSQMVYFKVSDWLSCQNLPS